MFDWSTVLLPYLEEFTYLGIFVLLLLCGFGLPIPEELILVSVGFMVYLGIVNPYLAVATSLLGVMIGDLLVFYIGHKSSALLLHSRYVQRLLSPDRLRRVKASFARHQHKTIFLARFVMGLRLAAFWTAGSLGMPALRFFLLDLTAALISLPLAFFVGYYFGEHIHLAVRMLRGLEYVVIGAGLVVVMGIILLRRLHERADKVKD